MGCTSCTLLQLAPSGLDPGVLAGRHGHGTAHSSTMQRHQREWAESLQAKHLSRRDMVIDISCGDGLLLAELQKSGLDVLGLEADVELLSAARRRGVDAIQGSLEEGFKYGLSGRADMVLANHALSHAGDLSRLLDTAVGVLRQGGRLAVEFHSALGLVVDTQFDVITHAHNTYLSLTAVKHLLASRGFRLLEAQENEAYGGSVRLVASRSVSGEPEPTEVRRILDRERSAGLMRPAGLTLAASAGRARQDIITFFASAQRRGLSVAGYGAPSRGVTLLNFCGLDSADLPFTVDRSIAKQGNVLPGCRVPVLDPAVLRSRRPDAVLLLVWPLLREIADELADIIAAGTVLVAPLPSLRVAR